MTTGFNCFVGLESHPTIKLTHFQTARKIVFSIYSQTTSKLKCVGSPCRIIYTVFGKPPVSLLKLFDYIIHDTLVV